MSIAGSFIFLPGLLRKINPGKKTTKIRAFGQLTCGRLMADKKTRKNDFTVKKPKKRRPNPVGPASFIL
jgi:hypothetical protein